MNEMTAAFMKLRARLPDYEHIHSKKQIVDQVGSSQNYKELDQDHFERSGPRPEWI